MTNGSSSSTSDRSDRFFGIVGTGRSHRIVVRQPAFLGRLRGLPFETNKSFLLPRAIPGIRRIRDFYDRHPAGTVLVVGHTDTVGQGSYNLVLSEERAEAVAAFLQDDPAPWLAWYGQGKPSGKRWGTREDQYMLSALPDPNNPFFRGTASGTATPATEAAVRRFQEWSNGERGTSLVIDGIAGPNTRDALVRAYMAQDRTTLPEGTEILQHGCGEFHPAEATGDEVASEANRRVEMFLFPGGAHPPPVRCRQPGCAEYQQWLDRVTEEIDVDAPVPVGLEGRITYPDDSPAAEVPFVVEVGGVAINGGYTDSDGRYRVDAVQGDALFRLCDEFELAGTADASGEVRVAVRGRPIGGGPDGEISTTA